jgi:hypothetical protein
MCVVIRAVLPRMVVGYALEMMRRNMRAEIVVADDLLQRMAARAW